LVKSNVETYVVTYNDKITGVASEPNGAKVTRVDNPVRTHVSILTWDLTLNQEVERAAANVYYGAGKHVDVIDVHDWHFIPAAATLKNALGIPFVYSVDSLEDHRSPGTDSPLNMAIRGIEWLGFYEAQQVTAKSEWMRSEIARLYKVPREKIAVTLPVAEFAVRDILGIYRAAAGGRIGI